MQRASGAGVAYFAVVFALGMLLGTLRVLVVAPLLGELRAVLLELPIMLAASWFASRWITGRLAVPAAVGPRIVMGTVALLLLLGAETGLSVLAFGRTLSEHLAAYRHGPAASGLAAQVLFGMFPLLQGLRRRR